jgi:hypothetical protein
MPQHKRYKKIIKPRLQWKLMLLFASLAAISVMVQTTAMATTMGFLSGDLPHDGEVLLGRVQNLLVINLVGTLLVVLPLHLLIGRLVTFKIAGPLYRFETYLRQIAAGERPGPCRIRKDDELQEFCRVLNAAVKPLSEPLAKESTEADRMLEEQPPLLPASELQQKAPVEE